VILALSVAAALVPTLFPGIDLAVTRYFMQPNAPLHTKDWLWVELINEHIPTLFRTWAVLCLPAWWLARRSMRYRQWAQPIAFVGLALLLGPGLSVSALKEVTQRARPFYVTEFGGDKKFSPALQIANQCHDDNCAFVSGHTADGFFLVGLMLISPRRRAWWVAFGVASGMLIGFARVSVGAHWLSDALWAFPVTLLASGLVWWALNRFSGHPTGRDGDSKRSLAPDQHPS
jgi:lipid A 4'-phosphatase